ncbi:hypothetical protein HPB52_025227 [Rhipicephalus sanguineus]|uniref:Carboxypeptidase n=1 Tax=Rhipicephalus sanguineus TaxID=34632 RepID=A0A9D4TDA3_RHISA|nr:hypothetical protein HPB52_025227 [Rhipicephalus sanguineus]
MISEVILAVLSLSTLTASSDPSPWEVTSVPGLDQPVNFKHYSGFVDAGEGRRLHYCSLVGAIAELGPFRVGYQGINMTMNPSPGTRYDETLANHFAPPRRHQTTDENYLATLNFFEEYPEFKRNDFYIAGESYAGVYVPLLAQRFVKDPRGGYAVGNGALDMELLGNSIMFFGYYHGLFGQRLWKELTSNCCNGSISQETCDFGWSTKNPACVEPVKKANQIILSSGLNVYNLYDPCNYDQGSSSLALRYSDSTMQHAFRRLIRKLFKWPTSCIDQDRLQLYFNRRDVIEALHVESPCSGTLQPGHQLHRAIHHDARGCPRSGRVGPTEGLIYNGDVDMACNFLGDDWFVHSLGYEPTSEYRMWHLDGVIAGFVQNFEHDITFVTVKVGPTS